MAIDLTQYAINPGTRINGYGGYNLVAGDRIIIQVAGETELEQTVPAGKALSITISIRADLTDA